MRLTTDRSDRLFTVATLCVLATPVIDVVQFAYAMWHHRMPASADLLIRDAFIVLAWGAVYNWRGSSRAWQALYEDTKPKKKKTEPATTPTPPGIGAPRVFEVTNSNVAIALAQHVLTPGAVADGAYQVGLRFLTDGNALVTVEPLPPGCKPLATITVQQPRPVTSVAKAKDTSIN